MRRGPTFLKQAILKRPGNPSARGVRGGGAVYINQIAIAAINGVGLKRRYHVGNHSPVVKHIIRIQDSHDVTCGQADASVHGVIHPAVLLRNNVTDFVRLNDV